MQARTDRALPLADERSWGEQTIETEEVLCHLAQTLQLDFNMDGNAGETAVQRFWRLARELALARSPGQHNEEELGVAWNNTAEFFFEWDAKIQDALAAGSFTVASAYQLGRGLAEVFWMLDPEVTEPTNPRCALYLLGPVRRQTFARLLPRLSNYFPDSSANAVAASLLAWAQVANDGLLRSPDVVSTLHEQLRVWHDLLLVGQPPDACVGTNDRLSRARRIGPVLRAFIPEVSIALLSLAAAIAAAALFALGSGSSHAVASILSVFSFFGITSAGALAKAKGEAHTLFERLGKAMDADLIKESITLPPARAYLDRGHRRPSQSARAQHALKEVETSLSGSPLAPAR